MGFLTQFGVQPVLLLAQVVNFFILLFILKKLLYRPILKVLGERKAKIAQSLKNAEEIEARLAKTEAEKQQKIDEAVKEGKSIILDASSAAEAIIKEAHLKAEADIKRLVDSAHQNMEVERQKLHHEIKAEIADIVVAAMTKVTPKVLSKQDQEEIAKTALSEVK